LTDSASAGDDELRRRLLRLLLEDEEFRLAVAGAIGLGEVLEELRWLRRKSLEHDKRFNKMNRRLSRIEMELGALSESFYSPASGMTSGMS